MATRKQKTAEQRRKEEAEIADRMRRDEQDKRLKFTSEDGQCRSRNEDEPLAVALIENRGRFGFRSRG